MVTRLISVALFLLIGCMSKAYCVTVDGLKLDKFEEKLERPRGGETATFSRLDHLLKDDDSYFQEATWEEVVVTLSDTVSHASLVDTDDESSVQSTSEQEAKRVYEKLKGLGVMKNVKQKENLNRSRYQGRARAINKTLSRSYNPQNNYLIKWPDTEPNTGEVASQVPTSTNTLNSQRLFHKLSSDAFLISASGVTDRPGSTTCLCVALRDNQGYVKKFIFHNGENLLAQGMREKAHELGYDVIQTDQPHAEGQLMQFLRQRHQKRPGWYTHILGMGCSRSHCVECDHLLRLCLGANYNLVTASINTKNEELVDIEANLSNTIKTCVLDANIVATSNSSELVVHKHLTLTGNVVYGQDAISTKFFDKFYLPLALQNIIQDKVDVSLDFSNERFTKNKKRTQ
jgi:hypothetical protein